MEVAKEEQLKVYGRNEKLHSAMKKYYDETMNSKSRWISKETFKETLKSYKNVFLHVAGHTHSNKINAIGEGENSYWEVQTSSISDYPQQSRVFEIVYEGNGIGAIHTCVVDHNSAEGSLAYKARKLAYEDEHDKGSSKSGLKEDRNSILRFNIPKEIEEKLK